MTATSVIASEAKQSQASEELSTAARIIRLRLRRRSEVPADLADDADLGADPEKGV